MHPLQLAISFLFVLSAVIVMLTAFQASTEVVPDLDFFVEKVHYEGKTRPLIIAMLEEVKRLPKRGLRGLVARFLIKNAEEYVRFEIWGAAAVELSRAYTVLKSSRTTSERRQP